MSATLPFERGLSARDSGVWSALRASARSIAFVAVTAALYGVWLCGDRVARGAARRRWRHCLFRAWAKAVAAIARMRVVVRGDAPAAPFFLVANHLSYMDVVTLSSVLDCTYVARGDVAAWPAVGRLCAAMRVIFVDRTRRTATRRAADDLDRALGDGESVVLFPEGTSTAGGAVLPFRSSLLEPAVRRRVAVYAASLSYRTPEHEPAARDAVCWWGDMTFLSHLFALFRLSRFDAEIAFAPQPIAAADRKELAASLHRAVVALQTPTLEER